MQELKWLTKEISKRYGNVRRCRGCYLYTEKGTRLTDCFLDGGRAILGWDGGKARTAFKNAVERGATGFYTGSSLSRLATAVKKLLPSEYSEIRWLYDSEDDSAFADGNSAFGAGNSALAAATNTNDADNGSAFGTAGNTNGTDDSAKCADNSAKGAAHDAVCDADKLAAVKASSVLWRPWLDFSADAEASVTRYPKITMRFTTERPDIIKIVPPFPWAADICFYAFKDTYTANGGFVPENAILPFPLAEAYTRAFFDMKTALGEYGEEQFKQFTRQLSPFFERKACYLFPKADITDYETFVLKALDAGIVISPVKEIPSIVPWKANPGDLKKLAAALTGEARP